MQGDLFSTVFLAAASRVALFLIVTSLVMALLVRLSISMFPAERVKVRKKAATPPVAGRRCPAGIHDPNARTKSKGEPSTELLSTAVMRYLDQIEACNPEPVSERTEEHLIRSQKDKAAEMFRTARIEQIERNGWDA